MIAEYQTNHVYFSEILKSNKAFATFINDFTGLLNTNNISYNFLPKTRDIQVRDFMPVQTDNFKFVEYRFDPDYLQGEENRMYKSYPDIICNTISLRTLKSDVLLDGGNIIKSESAVILTDKVLIENEGVHSPKKLLKALTDYFNTDKIILIPWDEKNDDYGHADRMLRFINNDTVLIDSKFDHYSTQFKDKLYGALKVNGINTVQLQTGAASKSPNKKLAYLNFLQTADIIVVPKYGNTFDEMIFEQFKHIFPDYAARNRIFQLDASALEIESALHSITWTIKK